ncbi:MAG: hypothetical protein GF417_11650 [Candidatus Latescibacteria bacterium]|nr:hypothetical protein [bacterium]MBD3425079.1 hypothetical protein [Candidatus Latescibacterota bacterium]
MQRKGNVMSRYFSTIFTLFCLIISVPEPSSAMEGRLMRHPDIHDDTVIFTYEDDLWSSPAEGGMARRLTSHPGMEQYAAFSPDGQYVAFTGSYDGGHDVYIMPSVGGEPVRLTFHPAYDRVTGWTPDGGAVLFVSFRGLKRKLYRVKTDGSFPVEYRLDRVSHASLSPDGVCFNRFYSDRMNWKGYRGGRQQDIWIADPDGKNFERLTEWEGYDNFPIWINNQVFFNSDRSGGRMNLHLYDLNSRKITRCTDHGDWDVEFPAGGKNRIVYGCQGYLWIYDILTGKSRKLEITIPADRWQRRDTYITPMNYTQELSPDRTGDRCLVQARGDIYMVDQKKERAVNITRTPGSRELHPAISPERDSIAFFSDRTGEYELYVSPAEPGAEWKQITSGSGSYYYHLKWSPDGTKILFGDKDFVIRMAELDNGRVTEIDRCPYQKDNEIFWEVSDYSWSPDSRWVVYSRVEQNLNSSIFIYHLETGERTRLTDDRYDDYSPAFGAKGDYIFFLSLRNFTPQLDWMMDNNVNQEMSTVMAMQLRSGEKPPFGDSGSDESGGDDEESPHADSLTIHREGIGERIFTVPIPPGTYRMLSAAKGKIAYLSRENYGFPGVQEFFYPRRTSHYTLHSFDLKSEEDTEVIAGIGSYRLSTDGSSATYISGSLAGVVSTSERSSPGEGMLEWGGIRHRVDTSREYSQIYRDVWRQIRDFFYDPDMHGKDWQGIYQKYLELIPYVATRADMNYIIGHMIGELTASHEYIVSSGGPPRTYFNRVSTGLLGADLEPDYRNGRYRFSNILEGNRWKKEYRNPLRAPHIQLEKGDYLISINGHDITTAENYFSYLENRTGDMIEIGVSSTPDSSETRYYEIETLYTEYNLRYYQKVENSYRQVRERTDGRVGYIHLADMDELGLRQFERGFRSERYRDGLIIDVRNNGGGFVSWFMIDKLERELQYMTVTRDFEPMRYPHGVCTGPVVVLCDEETGSDGEVFTQHFKDQNLGTVIGAPTWGGLIGIINMIPLTDGGMVTQSNVGFANMEGEWIVENRGVQPDILIYNRPGDIIRGKDKQLDLAIEYILDRISNSKGDTLVPPPFPVK